MKNKIIKRNLLLGSGLLGFFIAGLQVLGYSFSKQSNWNLIYDQGTIQWKMVVLWIGVALLFSILIYGLYMFLEYEGSKKKEHYVISYRKIAIICGVILLCWLPYFIIHYPCSFNPDVRDQLGQFFHDGSMCWTTRYVNLSNPEVSFWNNHHPVTHTLIVGSFAKLGIILGDARIGLFLLVLIQAIALSLVFAYIICYVREKGASKKLCAIIWAFYALWPLHALSVDSLCKDTLFTIFLLIATILLIKLLESPKEFLSVRNMVLVCIVFIMQGLMRNNGLYLLVVMFPIILFLGKGARKKIVVCFLIPILFLGVFMPKVVFRVANIAPGSEKEMYSVLFQQIARTLKEHGNEIEKRDIKVIENVMCPGESYHVLQKSYVPNNADPVKYRYNMKLTSKEKSEFFKVWFKYLRKYPSTYIQATMNNDYEYIYYERFGRETYYSGIQVQDQPIMGLKNTTHFQEIRTSIERFMSKVQKNVWTGWTINIGFYMCVFIVLLGYAVISKRYRLFWGYGLILCNILINFLGPLVYMRYAYFYIASIPLLIGLLAARESRHSVCEGEVK